MAEANGAEGEGQSSVVSLVQLGREQVAMKEYVCWPAVTAWQRVQLCEMYSIPQLCSMCHAAGAPVGGRWLENSWWPSSMIK